MALAQITSVAGTAVHVPGNDIDTDRIIPARFMKCVTFDGLGEYFFYDVRKTPEGEDKEHPLNDPADIRERYERRLAGVLDAGACALEPTTVIDLTGDTPQIVRLGLGDPALLGLSHG